MSPSEGASSPRLNRRPPKKYTVDGVALTIRELAEQEEVNESTMRKRIATALKKGWPLESVRHPAYYVGRGLATRDEQLMGKVVGWMRTHNLAPNSVQLMQMGEWEAHSTALAFLHRMVEQGHMVRDDDGNFMVPGVWLPKSEVDDLVQLLKGTIAELNDTAEQLEPDAVPLRLTVEQQQQGLRARASALAAVATRLQAPETIGPEHDLARALAAMQPYFEPLSYVENLDDRPGPKEETPGDVQ